MTHRPTYPPGYPPPVRPAAGHPAPALSPGGQPLAGFVDRLLAWLIDYAILSGVLLGLSLPVFVLVLVSLLDEVAAGVEPTFAALVLPWLLASVGLVALAVALSYVHEVEVALRGRGQTFGKRVARVRVVPVDPAAGFGREMLTRRWLAAHLTTVFLPGFWLVDGLWQLGDQPYRQCLHDKFARTVVVKEPS